MVAKKIITLSFILCLIACNRHEKDNMVFLEINNAELKKEISHFMQRLDTTVEYKYVMWVKCNVIKDTISEYFIFPNPTFAFLDSEPFHFVCSVDERPVFFEVRSLSSIDCETPVFKIKREALMDLIKREFPKEYNDLMQLKENEVYLPFIPNEYPETLVLIFINGKLSNKKNGRGLLERSFDVQMDKVR